MLLRLLSFPMHLHIFATMTFPFSWPRTLCPHQHQSILGDMRLWIVYSISSLAIMVILYVWTCFFLISLLSGTCKDNDVINVLQVACLRLAARVLNTGEKAGKSIFAQVTVVAVVVPSVSMSLFYGCCAHNSIAFAEVEVSCLCARNSIAFVEVAVCFQGLFCAVSCRGLCCQQRHCICCAS